jgi:hypothetical protein
MLLAWAAAFAWWWLLPPSQTVELTIPAGTAGAVAAGAVPPGLPGELAVRVGDTLAVRNLDDIPHRIGPLWVAAGASDYTPVGKSFFAGGALVCTIHPAGALAVAPRARPSVAVTIPVALLAGVPMGLAAVIALGIVRRLDTT